MAIRVKLSEIIDGMQIQSDENNIAFDK